MKPFIVAALLAAAPLSWAAQHVAVISVDGLGASELGSASRCLAPDATIRKLARQGAWAEAVTGVLPTVTYPSHATIVTGADPAKHGVIDNGAPGRFWLQDRADIRADTLWDAAKREGRSVAIVTWPSSYGADVDWRIPEDLAPRTNPQEDIRKGSTPGLFDALSAAVGTPALVHFGHPDSGTPLDRMTASFAAEIVRRHKPKLRRGAGDRVRAQRLLVDVHDIAAPEVAGELRRHEEEPRPAGHARGLRLCERAGQQQRLARIARQQHAKDRNQHASIDVQSDRQWISTTGSFHARTSAGLI